MRTIVIRTSSTEAILAARFSVPKMAAPYTFIRSLCAISCNFLRTFLWNQHMYELPCCRRRCTPNICCRHRLSKHQNETYEYPYLSVCFNPGEGCDEDGDCAASALELARVIGLGDVELPEVDVELLEAPVSHGGYFVLARCCL